MCDCVTCDSTTDSTFVNFVVECWTTTNWQRWAKKCWTVSRICERWSWWTIRCPAIATWPGSLVTWKLTRGSGNTRGAARRFIWRIEISPICRFAPRRLFPFRHLCLQSREREKRSRKNWTWIVVEIYFGVIFETVLLLSLSRTKKYFLVCKQEHEFKCSGPVERTGSECSAEPQCPHPCRCADGIVDCRENSLTKVPTHLPEDTTELFVHVTLSRALRVELPNVPGHVRGILCCDDFKLQLSSKSTMIKLSEISIKFTRRINIYSLISHSTSFWQEMNEI